MNDVNELEKEHVQCNVCLKEIPASEAQSAEASDYIAHFCGLDCFDKWTKKAEQEQTGG